MSRSRRNVVGKDTCGEDKTSWGRSPRGRYLPSILLCHIMSDCSLPLCLIVVYPFLFCLLLSLHLHVSTSVCIRSHNPLSPPFFLLCFQTLHAAECLVRVLVSLGDRSDRIDDLTSQYPSCAVTTLTPISSSRRYMVDDGEGDRNSSRANSTRVSGGGGGARTGSLVTPRSRRVSPVPSPTGSPRSGRRTVSDARGTFDDASSSSSVNNPTSNVIPSTALTALAESNRDHVRSSFDSEHAPSTGRASLDRLTLV